MILGLIYAEFHADFEKKVPRALVFKNPPKIMKNWNVKPEISKFWKCNPFKVIRGLSYVEFRADFEKNGPESSSLQKSAQNREKHKCQSQNLSRNGLDCLGLRPYFEG